MTRLLEYHIETEPSPICFTDQELEPIFPLRTFSHEEVRVDFEELPSVGISDNLQQPQEGHLVSDF